MSCFQPLTLIEGFIFLTTMYMISHIPKKITKKKINFFLSQIRQIAQTETFPSNGIVNVQGLYSI